MQNTFAERLTIAMALAGVNQMSLASASGVPQGTISRLLGGQRNAHVATLRALARALDVSLAWLADGSLVAPTEPQAPPPDQEPATQTELLRAILEELREIRKRL